MSYEMNSRDSYTDPAYSNESYSQDEEDKTKYGCRSGCGEYSSDCGGC